jgi:hypothetical protein
VGVFGPTKANMARIHPAPNLSKQSKKILKILGAIQQIPFPPILISTFR